VSLFIVFFLAGYEVYKDTKANLSSLTWGVLFGFLVAVFVPIINTITAIYMAKNHLSDFLFDLDFYMDKPIFKDKTNTEKS
jgi:uncharacterized membrane protein (DUF485 family)